MKRWQFAIFGLAAACALAHGDLAHAAGKCSSESAKSAEERLSSIDAWPCFAAFYKRAGDCDTSALSYAFTQAIVKLAGQSNGIADLSAVLRGDPWLRDVVLRHLRSEAIARDDADRIIANARETCPVSGASICSEIRQALSP